MGEHANSMQDQPPLALTDHLAAVAGQRRVVEDVQEVARLHGCQRRCATGTIASLRWGTAGGYRWPQLHSHGADIFLHSHRHDCNIQERNVGLEN